MEDLYNIISNLCKSRNISGGKMCSEIGVSRSFLTELKKGRSKTLTLPTAQKLADYFNVPLETFTGEAANTIAPVDEIKDELFEKRKILFDLSSKATKEDLDKFIKMMNVMLGEE